MIGAVVVGGGRGERFKGNKVFFPVSGKPLLFYTLIPFVKLNEISHIVIVVKKEDIENARKVIDLVKKFEKKIEVVEGGERRRDSVLNGLKALKKYPVNKVLIHDAVRPLVSTDTIKRVISGIEKDTACIPCIPLRETVKFVEDGRVIETPDRKKLCSVQTPEGFPFPLILEKIEELDEDMYDDAMAFEKNGLYVKTVKGNTENIKVTYREDILFVERIVDEYKDWYRI